MIYNIIIDPDWLPERVLPTYSNESKKRFTKLGWPVTIGDANPIANVTIPVNNQTLNTRIDVRNDSNGGNR